MWVGGVQLVPIQNGSPNIENKIVVLQLPIKTRDSGNKDRKNLTIKMQLFVHEKTTINYTYISAKLLPI